MTDIAQLTLPQMLRHHAQTHPDKIALRQKDFGIWQPVSWKNYFERVCVVAHGFRACGVEKGGHVAILSDNRLEWVLSQLAANAIQAVNVGVYPTSPANEVAYVLEHSDAQIVVCEDQEQLDKVLEVREKLPKLQMIVVVEEKGLRNYKSDTILSFAELEARGRAHQAEHPSLIDDCLADQPDRDIAMMVYTSGSTGNPKGAMISFRNVRAQAIAAIDLLGLKPDSTHLSYLPLCHVAEQIVSIMAPVYMGSQVNFGESLRTVQEDLREVGPNMFLGVPRIWEKLHSSIYIRMLEAGKLRKGLFDWAFALCAPFAEKAPHQRSVMETLKFQLCYWLIFRALQNYTGLRRAKIAMTGAAPIAPAIVHFFRTMGVPLIEVYGATETSGLAIGQTLDKRLPGSVGKAIKGLDLRIGEHGELLLKGGIIFAGYYKNESATEATIRDGWLHTGDVIAEEDGEIRIVDRLKDIMITAGGKNLSPSEIENTVKSSPYIKECIVIGEARKFVSALIQIDFETTAKWAEESGLSYTNFRNLSEKSETMALVDSEIAKANGQLAAVANIRKFHLLTKELDHDDGEMTATMKVRRSKITDQYAEIIEGFYSKPKAAAAE